jgi:hypothetical protein
MLQNPEAPLSPDRLNDIIVADWLLAIVRFDICELEIFPVNPRFTVEPL